MQKLHFTQSKTGRIRIEDRYGRAHTIIDETGNRYDRLTVLRFIGMTNAASAIFLFECDCGKRLEVIGSSLRSKNSKSCGCYNKDCIRQRNHEHRETKHSRFRDLAGIKQHDGRLTAIKVVGFDEEFRHAQWLCRCDCGNEVIVRRGQFLSGGTKSCGCRKQENDATRWVGRKNPKFIDGRSIGRKQKVKRQLAFMAA